MEKQILRHDKQCRLCGSKNLALLLQLNETPLEDQFVNQEKKNIPQPVYPLELAICLACGYVHLPYIVSPEASYADYVYESGVTVGLRNHYDEYAKKIVYDYKVSKDSLAVDLGSNDGSMLASFKALGLEVVGVEPAEAIANHANTCGLPTINNFFTEDVAALILEERGLASIITANYMYANIDDVISFTKIVSRLLSPDGIFVVQTGYHPEQMKKRMFDYIYHEHFSYFTVEVLKNIFSLCGLELIQATKIEPKGGSIRVVGQLQSSNRPVDSSVAELIQDEQTSGMSSIETYQKFVTEIEESKKQVLDRLHDLQSSGKKIVGFGASHSTTTLTYHFELAQYMEYIVDDNKLKHNTFSPGYHLPVHSSEILSQDTPDYAILLAWQHQQSIAEKHKSFLDRGGKFIIPLPELKILGADYEEQ
jgi:hypothetical protein